jgi:hypothetical protein
VSEALPPGKNSAKIDLAGSDVTDHVQRDRLPDGTPGEVTIAAPDPANEVGSPEWAAATMAEVQQREAENNATIERLRAQGIGVQLPGVNILQFVTLLDMVLGDASSPGRAAFELAVQQRVAEQLASAEGQTARAKLLAPAAAPGQVLAGGPNGLPHPHRPLSGLILPG